MKKLIMLTGPMGVGKTTIGKLLSDKLGKTAFIDGDWCIDIHPFIGNKNTKGMAINNIIHMIRNYYHLDECDNIVISWVMSENTTHKIKMGVSDLDLDIYSYTLLCEKDELLNRWKNDQDTKWRVDEWLKQSLKSIEYYNNFHDTVKIDTSGVSIENVVNRIINEKLNK